MKLPPRDPCVTQLCASQLTRRSLCCALALATSVPPAALAAQIRYTRSASGLLYFDVPRGRGFDDVPCLNSCLKDTWTLDPEAVDPESAAVKNEVGSQVIVNYRVRRGFFNGEIASLSDSAQGGGSVLFTVGDGTMNAAVDELVRTLPQGQIRRAVIPAEYDLDRGTRAEYPRPEPPGTTYLELSIRPRSASGPLGACPGFADERMNNIYSSICKRD